MPRFSYLTFVASLALFALACQPNSEPPQQTLPYTVISDEIDESPGKTQVSIDVVVPEDASEPELRELLLSLYDEASGRTGFRHHRHPTLVAVYAYPSREHAESGMGQWSAMLIKGPLTTGPEITIRGSVNADVGEVNQHGYAEDERRDIFRRIIEAEDRAQSEAERKHPEDLMEQYRLARELAEANRSALARELDLTPEQLREISNEGLEKNWPIPRR